MQLLCERARASNDGWIHPSIERQSHGLVTNWGSLELLNQHIEQAVAVFLEDSRTRLEAMHRTHGRDIHTLQHPLKPRSAQSRLGSIYHPIDNAQVQSAPRTASSL